MKRSLLVRFRSRPFPVVRVKLPGLRVRSPSPVGPVGRRRPVHRGGNRGDDGKKPAAYIADTTTANAQVRTLSETVRLDSRTKLLNPLWYEGMLSHGYEGVRELSKRLVNTMGWSATADAVDNWVYEDVNTTFIQDEEMCRRLMSLNPNSFRKMVGTLLEVNGRGYWETNQENLDRLQELYQEVEDRIEGVE